MKILNYFEINSWSPKSFLKLVIIIQILFLELSYLNNNIYSSESLYALYIMHILITFIYFNLIPGFYVLKIFRLFNVGMVKSFIYSLSISTCLIMVFMFIISIFNNHIYLNVFNKNSIVLTYLIFNIIMIIYIFYRGEKRIKDPYIEITNYDVKNILLILFLPFFSYVSIIIKNFYDYSIFIIILIFIISIYLFISLNSKKIDEIYFPLLIFSISFSLVLYNSLYSNYLWGFDVHLEYFSYLNVVDNSSWDFALNNNISSSLNGMMSITLLPTIYKLVLNINDIYFFKIYYPFILSVSIAYLYYIYKNIFTKYNAMISVFYIIFIKTYFTELLTLNRQIIAEFFFIVLLSVFYDDFYYNKGKIFIIYLLSIGLIASHYGVTFLYIIMLFFSYMYLLFFKKLKYKYHKIKLLIIIAVLSYTYYSMVSNSSIIISSVNIFKYYVINYYKDIFNTESSNIIINIRGSYIDIIYKLLYYFSQLLIFVGLLYSNISKKNNINNEYKIFSNVMFIMLISSLIFKELAFKIQRLYHISSLLLSPFLYIGYNKIVKIITLNNNNKKLFKVLISVFLIIFLFFNTGLIQELTYKSPISLPLNSKLKDSHYEYSLYYYKNILDRKDILGFNWLNNYKNSDFKIYADYTYTSRAFLSYAHIYNNTFRLTKNIKFTRNSYIYLGNINTKFNFITYKDNIYEENFSTYEKFNKLIYNSRSVKIYYK